MNYLLRALVGSQSYGTAIPTSDMDYKGVYVQSIDELIGFGYKEQIEKGKDECYFEVRRFLQLLQSANPTMLELLYTPEDCILEKHPAFDLILAERDQFMTKICMNSFGGYAVQQIKKARGLDKKMNWATERVERKGPLEFCWVYVDGKTVPVTKWLRDNGMQQEHIGLVSLDHMRDCYAMYYDHAAQYGAHRGAVPLGFRGIVLDDSNAVRLSDVPKGMTAHGIMYYNKDAYSKHCKDWFSYQEWMKNRNTQRYVDNKSHDQQIDGKNLMHCRRLLDMAMEIATTGTLTVRRPNRDYLLAIRRGEVNLTELIDKAEEDVKAMEDAFKNSSLPDNVDPEFVNELLVKVRHAYYEHELQTAGS